MDLGLKGRRALVTGGSTGLGFSCAKALVAEGAEVVLSSRSAQKLESAVSELGGAAQWVAADVSDREQATSIVAEATELLGGLDILIANAGGPPAGNFAVTELDAYEPALRLNLLSTVSMCKAAVPAMAAQGWGRVVAITSLSVRQPMEQLILSNTARAGVTAFLKTLAREVAGDGVTVNSLQPGQHKTDRLASVYSEEQQVNLASNIPAGFIGDPDDFGQVAAFLCSEYARFITGAAIPVDGGVDKGLQ